MPIEERTSPANSFDLLKNPWSVWCEKPDCYLSFAAPSYEEGVKYFTMHKCPYMSPSRGFLVSQTTVQKCWTKLDVAVVELLQGNWPDNPDGTPHEERVRLKGVCRGMAEIIAELMGSTWDADAVSKEAGERYKAKQEGREHITPGLEPSMGKPHMTREQKEVNNKAGSPPTKRSIPSVGTVSKFKPEEIKAIKAATEMGMMSKKELAKMYKVSEEVIQQAIDS